MVYKATRLKIQKNLTTDLETFTFLASWSHCFDPPAEKNRGLEMNLGR